MENDDKKKEKHDQFCRPVHSGRRTGNLTLRGSEHSIH